MAPRVVRTYTSAMHYMIAFGVVLSVLGVVEAPTASAQADLLERPLSAGETRRLEAGQLVIRRTQQRRGRLQLVGGVSWQVIDSSPERVWRAARDVPRFKHWMPEVERSTSRGTRGGRQGVLIEHEYGPITLDYLISMRFDDEQKDITFRLDDSHDNSIRAAWGFFTLRPHGNGKTLVTFGVMVDIGDGVISGALRPEVHRWMMRIPSELKRYLRGRARARYRD